MLGQLGVPGDFDVAQLTWKPHYDPFFYEQLAKRARRLCFYKDEYIVDTGALLVEGENKPGFVTSNCPGCG